MSEQPKPRYLRQSKDDLAWEKNEEATDAWINSILGRHHNAIAELILKYKPGKAVELHVPVIGGYNITWQLDYDDGTAAALRIPIQGSAAFPEEKMEYEVATMRYVAAHTTIPVPRIYYFGKAVENPIGLGPFMVMEYIHHVRTLSHALNDPSRSDEDGHQLDLDISPQRLEALYRQMANIIAQLAGLEFPRIGSLLLDQGGEISVGARPLIQNMNSMVTECNIPESVLPSPSTTYNTADDLYTALGDMHMVQLVFQHNDIVDEDDGEDDVRDKYVARQLFRQLAANGRLSREPDCGDGNDDQNSFRIFNEDLRPSNVLIDAQDRVVAVVDWEFAYVAPARFLAHPPWWLLLMEPDRWPGGYRGWMPVYEPRLDVFLRVLAEEEDKLGGKSEIAARMRRSWESKAWMVGLAARKSWLFDALYWRFLDPMFFGDDNKTGDHKARLKLLSKPQLAAMEPFVQVKMDEAKQRLLVEWEGDSAAVHLAKLLV